MLAFLKSKLVTIIVLVVLALLVFGAFKAFSPDQTVPVTATVDIGPVRQLVSVSGVIRAEDTAALSFPKSGVVENVLVRKGDVVAAGAVLATLNTDSLLADQADALANLRKAEAALAELKAGTTAETKNVTSETVALKTAILENTKSTAAIKVTNAKRALLSNDLSAVSTDPNENALPPIISGTYTCQTEGSYQLEPFRSGTDSGYSFNFSGIEKGLVEVTTSQPAPFGQCGLWAQFFTDGSYTRSRWIVEIPNQNSPTYLTFKNAYELAVNDAATTIALAEQELALAKANAESTNATTRPEIIAQAEAAVASAAARVARVEADLADSTLKAPFAGTIISTSILPGETVTTAPVINLQSGTRYELTARIPEVDISRLSLGQNTEVVFDTRAEEVLLGQIDFLSPQATTIDGVAYYEARILLDSFPTWLRSGLNADIDIIIEARENVTRLPNRFIITQADGKSAVLKTVNQQIATSTVEILFKGNDGYTAIAGLTSGEQVVAP